MKKNFFFFLQDISSVDGGPLCILGTALNREQKVELHKKAMFLKAKIVEEFNPEGKINLSVLCIRSLSKFVPDERMKNKILHKISQKYLLVKYIVSCHFTSLLKLFFFVVVGRK